MSDRKSEAISGRHKFETNEFFIVSIEREVYHFYS